LLSTLCGTPPKGCRILRSLLCCHFLSHFDRYLSNLGLFVHHHCTLYSYRLNFVPLLLLLLLLSMLRREMVVPCDCLLLYVLLRRRRIQESFRAMKEYRQRKTNTIAMKQTLCLYLSDICLYDWVQTLKTKQKKKKSKKKWFQNSLFAT